MLKLENLKIISICQDPTENLQHNLWILELRYIQTEKIKKNGRTQ